MPEPIASSSYVPWTPADQDLYSSEPPPEEPSASEDPYAGVGPLAEYAEPPPTNNNAQRTTARHRTSAYAEAGLTSSGDSVYAGVAALKTHDPATETDVEVFTVSGQ